MLEFGRGRDVDFRREGVHRILIEEIEAFWGRSGEISPCAYYPEVKSD